MGKSASDQPASTFRIKTVPISIHCTFCISSIGNEFKNIHKNATNKMTATNFTAATRFPWFETAKKSPPVIRLEIYMK